MDNHYINFFYSLIFHIFILFTVLSIIYWLVFSKTDNRKLYDNINKTIENDISDITINRNLLSEETYDTLSKLYSNDNEFKIQNNKNILTLNITIIVFLLLLFVLTLFTRYVICGNSINIGKIIVENVIILALVAIFEILFFRYFTNDYVSILPSEITELIKENIQK